MFARLTTVQVKKERMDEAIRFYRESVVPVAKSQIGFVAAYLLADRKRAKGVSITFWDSEENAVANEKSGYYLEQVTKFLGYFSAAPIAEDYEVAIQV